MKTIGVLALQGCVQPHRAHIEALGAKFLAVKTKKDLEICHGMILPGGESSTQLKLLKRFDLWEPLRDFAQQHPTWGICAGSILL